MKKCYVCETELNDTNRSEEHILLNACGGRLKSKDLLCQACNSKFGSKSDRKLATQLESLSSLLHVKKERGSLHPIVLERESGEEWVLNEDRTTGLKKTSVKPNLDGSYSIITSNDEELRDIISGIYKKNGKNLSRDEINQIVEANMVKTQINEKVNLKIVIGGEDEFRSIAKSAINYFIFCGGDQQYIRHLLPYIEGKVSMNIVRHHYNPDLVPPREEVSHIICIIGNPSEKILYAYIEFFNCNCFIVNLNENYNGDAICNTYIFDLFTQTEQDRKIPIEYTRSDLLSFFNKEEWLQDLHKKNAFQEMNKRYCRVLNIGQWNQIIQKAIDASFKNYPEGILMTKEMINEFIKELTKELIPFIKISENESKN